MVHSTEWLWTFPRDSFADSKCPHTCTFSCSIPIRRISICLGKILYRMHRTASKCLAWDPVSPIRDAQCSALHLNSDRYHRHQHVFVLLIDAQYAVAKQNTQKLRTKYKTNDNLVDLVDSLLNKYYLRCFIIEFILKP